MQMGKDRALEATLLGEPAPYRVSKYHPQTTSCSQRKLVPLQWKNRTDPILTE